MDNSTTAVIDGEKCLEVIPVDEASDLCFGCTGFCKEKPCAYIRALFARAVMKDICGYMKLFKMRFDFLRAKIQKNTGERRI